MTIGVVALAAGTCRAADRCGDADDSGAITVTDGVQILRAAAGLASLCTPARCDLDTSGSVSVTDGVNVLRAAAGLAVNLACPGATPTCTVATVTVALAVPEPIGAATLSLAIPGRHRDAARKRRRRGGARDHSHRCLVAERRIAERRRPRGRLHADRPGRSRRRQSLERALRLPRGRPGTTRFACTLSDVTAPDGVTPIAGATCAVTVASE